MRKAALALAVVMLALLASESALAHGRGARVHFGVFIGAPVYWGGYWGPHYYYPPPYYYPSVYYPSVVAVPAAPTVYVEQSGAASAPAPAQPQGYWHYCAESQAYYPYVQQCLGGWQRVVPQPPPR